MNLLNPMLSVIVPAYNVENYIEQCINSICKQKFLDFELILVDDGSTDSTGEICDKYATRDKRIRVIHKPNGGLVSARKAGLSVSQGEFIAYVDGDDWIAADMLDRLYKCAFMNNVDVVISDFITVRGNEETLLTQNMESGFYDKSRLIRDVYPNMLCGNEYFSFGFQPSLCSKLFRRSLLLKYQDEVDNRIKLGEDAACFYPLMLEAESVFYLKECYFYYYRMREASISHSIVYSYYTDEILLLLNHLKKQFVESGENSGILMQLYLYGCYMLDNMVSKHLYFKEIFLNKNLDKQLTLFSNDEIGQKIINYCTNIRTSSKMKRVLRLMQRNTFRNKVNLYAFCLYERMNCFG